METAAQIALTLLDIESNFDKEVLNTGLPI
jgi:hypothetical protein